MKNYILTLLIALGFSLNTSAQENQPLRNAIRFSPIGVNEVGATIGLNYEHYFGEDTRISFIAPVDLVFRHHNNWLSNGGDPAYVFFSPGFKFYPSSKPRPVKYAIGSNLVFGTGKVVRSRWFSENERYEHLNNTRLGLMITNYVNFDITRRFTMGINFGLGFLYTNRTAGDNSSDGIGPTVQLGTNFGLKF